MAAFVMAQAPTACPRAGACPAAGAGSLAPRPPPQPRLGLAAQSAAKAAPALGRVLAGLAGACGLAMGGARRRAPARAPREPGCARSVVLTGRKRPSPPTPQTVYPKLEDENLQEFEVGWNSELGKWIDLKASGIKWWQRPGYLTPNGYRQPPHWNRRDYALCCRELHYAKIEADMVAILKRRGMTYQEIRAKANVYEFLENPKKPQMTAKMMFLLQVKCLLDGREDELVDMQTWADEDNEEESNTEVVVNKVKEVVK